MDYSIDDNHPVNQHYVPQFLLRRFCDNKTNQVYVYDKQTGRSFRTNIRNIIAERSFYDFKVDDKTKSIEKWLTQIEGSAANIIETKITREKGRFYKSFTFHCYPNHPDKKLKD